MAAYVTVTTHHVLFVTQVTAVGTEVRRGTENEVDKMVTLSKCKYIHNINSNNIMEVCPTLKSH